MPREFSRKVRVAESIKRSLAPLVGELARAAAPVMASVTAVEVTPDLKLATIFVSIYGVAEKEKEVMTHLRGELPRLRHAVATELRLRQTPVLELVLDKSLERGARIGQLLGNSKPAQD